MIPTIPIELRLYILELALPPPTQKNIAERRELCRALSLVHRDWTGFAQTELFPSLNAGKQASKGRKGVEWQQESRRIGLKGLELMCDGAHAGVARAALSRLGDVVVGLAKLWINRFAGSRI
ncbi:hypothetical protein JCM11641_000002 [Rhodosporidiobolus odoratus]